MMKTGAKSTERSRDMDTADLEQQLVSDHGRPEFTLVSATPTVSHVCGQWKIYTPQQYESIGEASNL